jgi:MFS family permease
MAYPQPGSRRFSALAPALGLLALAIVINYVDRGNLSIAAPLVKEELRLSATQLGILFSAFFYTYTALQFVVGEIVDRFGANWVLSAGLFVWSLATIGIGLAGGFVVLLALRLMLGIGESVAFPCSSKVIAEQVPLDHRGFANGLITAGLKLGPAVGAFGAGTLIAKYGWRPVFLWMGLASLLWLPAWLKWMPKPFAADDDRIGSDSVGNVVPGYSAIFRERSFWGCSLGHFCFNYLSYFLLTWLPFYLTHERHLSQATLAKTAGAFYLLDSMSALSAGWISDVFVRRGARPSIVRKGVAFLGSFVAAIGLLGCAFSDTKTYLPWLLVAAVGSGAAGCGVFLFAQTLAGPRAAGKWSALQNGFGNFAGIIGPSLTGFLVDRTGNFLSAFLLCASISVLGGLVWAWGIRFAPVDWSRQTEPAVTAAPTVT